nr:hypothetical protein [Tanacetum cinerariifolium]
MLNCRLSIHEFPKKMLQKMPPPTLLQGAVAAVECIVLLFYGLQDHPEVFEIVIESNMKVLAEVVERTLIIP